MKKALEPYIKLAPFVGIGLVVVAIAVAWIVYMQRGGQMEMITSVQKVRVLPLDENSSVAIVDFRLGNPTEYAFMVRTAEVTIVDGGGKTQEGMVVSEVDAKRLFEYYPQQLGQKFNASLIPKSRVKPHQSADWMLAARFEVPEKLVLERKSLRIRIEEYAGTTTEVVEGKQP